jgi:hypothetical protein
MLMMPATSSVIMAGNTIGDNTDNGDNMPATVTMPANAGP